MLNQLQGLLRRAEVERDKAKLQLKRQRVRLKKHSSSGLVVVNPYFCKSILLYQSLRSLQLRSCCCCKPIVLYTHSFVSQPQVSKASDWED